MNLSDFIPPGLDLKKRDCINMLDETLAMIDDRVEMLEEWLERRSDDWKARFRNEEVFEEFLNKLGALRDDLENAKDNFETAWQDLRINVEDPE